MQDFLNLPEDRTTVMTGWVHSLCRDRNKFYLYKRAVFASL
jgi:hypothetical protein